MRLKLNWVFFFLWPLVEFHSRLIHLDRRLRFLLSPCPLQFHFLAKLNREYVALVPLLVLSQVQLKFSLIPYKTVRMAKTDLFVLRYLNVWKSETDGSLQLLKWKCKSIDAFCFVSVLDFDPIWSLVLLLVKKGVVLYFIEKRKGNWLRLRCLWN